MLQQKLAFLSMEGVLRNKCIGMQLHENIWKKKDAATETVTGAR